MKREELTDLIISKQKQIISIEEEIQELYKDYLLLSDEKYWFKEKVELVIEKQGRKTFTVEKLIGRIYWNEDFSDESTEEVITIERNTVVRVNGKWDTHSIQFSGFLQQFHRDNILAEAKEVVS
jgi:hypothetical protein